MRDEVFPFSSFLPPFFSPPPPPFPLVGAQDEELTDELGRNINWWIRLSRPPPSLLFFFFFLSSFFPLFPRTSHQERSLGRVGKPGSSMAYILFLLFLFFPPPSPALTLVPAESWRRKAQLVQWGLPPPPPLRANWEGRWFLLGVMEYADRLSSPLSPPPFLFPLFLPTLSA